MLALSPMILILPLPNLATVDVLTANVELVGVKGLGLSSVKVAVFGVSSPFNNR
jgi:hypothetical protein